jgi:hypothetical protein
MWTAGVAFGERVMLLRRAISPPDVPARLLMPGPGRTVRHRASAAQLRPRGSAPSRPSHRGQRRIGGRTVLTDADSVSPEIVLPGVQDRAARVRSEWLGVDPDPVDGPAARRLRLLSRPGDLRRYQVLGDWSYWRSRVAHLSETAPNSELAALLEERPDLTDAPVGCQVPDGIASFRAQVRLDALAARQRLINSLQGDQYADAAELAVEYPHDQEFLTAEVALALDTAETAAGALLCAAFALATKLPGTLSALRSGAISSDVAEVMVAATSVLTDPAVTGAVEESVLPAVGGRSREWVRRRVCREVIRLDPANADQRHRIAREERRVSKWAEADGMGSLKVYAPIQDIAAAWEALTGLGNAAKTPGDDRTADQRRADVFAGIFHSILDSGQWRGTALPQQHGRRPHVGVLIPGDLLAGASAAATVSRRTSVDTPDRTSDSAAPSTAGSDQVCEIAGYGPVGPSQGVAIAAEGIWRRLVYDPPSGTLLDFGRTRYLPPDSLKQFVATRDQECAAYGCAQPAWRCDIDHAIPYSAGGTTDEANLSALCRHHHRSKDGGGWQLTINADRSKTWTSPLGRTRTKAATELKRPAERHSETAEHHATYTAEQLADYESPPF